MTKHSPSRCLIFPFQLPISVFPSHKIEIPGTLSRSSPCPCPDLCILKRLLLGSKCISPPLQGSLHEYEDCLGPASVPFYRIDTFDLCATILPFFFSVVLSPPHSSLWHPVPAERILSLQSL